MFDINKFKVLTSKESDEFTLFEIGPLPKGYGHTVGNAVRRILMSSISGSAITAVKIKSADHEYTTLEGLQEDLLTFVLNLKNISIKSHTEDPVRLSLNVKGKKDSVVEVKAGDFSKDSNVEIKNPELVIGHLTKNITDLEIEVIVETGIGYKLPDQSKRAEIGVIPVDGIFSPVKHVKLDVVQTRVGQQTDLDQVNLEVTTNGASTPKECFLEATKLFDYVANRLVDLGGGDSKTNKLEVEEEEVEEEEVQKLPIYEIVLSTRLRNSLINSNISDLVELEGRSRSEILSFKGMGKKSFDELMQLLAKHNITVNP